MITIEFNQSRSPRYPDMIKIAKMFDSYSIGETNKIFVSIKEIFEKWEFFNDIYWVVMDWKGTVVIYNDARHFSHSDKTKIFYALQQAHFNWINFTAFKLSSLHKVYSGQSRMIEIEGEYLTEDQVNYMIDTYSMKG